MGFFDFIAKAFKKKKKIVVNFSSDDLSQNEKVSAVMNENAYLKGILARVKAEEAKKREGKKDDEEEKETIKDLKIQEKELNKKDIKPFSLLKLAKFISKRKNRNKIILTTFDGSKVIGPLEDFAIMPDGGFGVVSNGGRVVWASKDLNNVFWWVNGLNTYARKKIIPLCVNSHGEFEPNIQTTELGELIEDTDGKFKIQRFNSKPLYLHLSEKISQINELNQDLEMREATIADQQKEITEKAREALLHKNRADKANTDLSLALNSVAEINNAQGLIAKQNMALTHAKESYEKLLGDAEKIFDDLREKLQKRGGKSIEELNFEKITGLVEWAKQNIPETVIQQVPKEPAPTLSEMVKPAKA